MSLYNDFSKKALNHYVFKDLNELNELIYLFIYQFIFEKIYYEIDLKMHS